MCAFHHLHTFGDWIDRHPAAIQTLFAALAFVAVGFLICPFWLRAGDRS